MPFLCSRQVVAPSNDFRQTTRLVEIPEVPAPSAGHVIVQSHFGDGVLSVEVSDAAAFQMYVEVPSSSLVKTPKATPEAMALPMCGVSASLAVKFVVQLAKLAGNYVIGMCSSDEKAEFLKALDVDRPSRDRVYAKKNIGKLVNRARVILALNTTYHTEW
ncbi:hypothetical protein PybrP1_004730 [[Pythium] brassicae (nom. inval.)]|nr:hypothetical protein PybrP1_004730 [[Pythium] brassicae (nom. inval.)]